VSKDKKEEEKINPSYFFSVYFLYLPIKHVKHEMLNSLTKMGQSICATAVQLG
jgi:hypothetical protein